MPITLLTIDEIDKKREILGIKPGRLCRRADIELTTYKRRLKDKSGGLFIAMLNLNKAIDELEREVIAELSPVASA